MKPVAFERWAATRQQGRARFILVTGLLTYALPLFLVMTFWVFRDRLGAFFIAASFLLWLCGGVAFGLLVWAFREWQFQRHLARRRGS